jgi:hypothetical protein
MNAAEVEMNVTVAALIVVEPVEDKLFPLLPEEIFA